MVVVGSKALETYFPIERIAHDWDLWMDNVEYQSFKQLYSMFFIKEVGNNAIFDFKHTVVEVKIMLNSSETDRIIFYGSNLIGKTMETPWGSAFVPSLQNLHDMKRSTALCIDEPKHHHDLKLMYQKTCYLENNNTILFEMRLKETRDRLAASRKVKFDFFHKYHIPEYILHDNLHEVIAKLLNISIPTYQRITVAETDIAEELFNKLTHEQKISLMVEESLVLGLERWFIPQMVENGINFRLIDLFDSNSESSPTYLILKHCCITGLKGEAEYITNFSRTNFFEIEKAWQAAKSVIKSKNGFPVDFYNQLFEIRAKYKQGEKVALI